MSGKVKYKGSFFIFFGGMLLSIILHIAYFGEFVLRQFIHSDFLHIIGMPIMIIGAAIFYAETKEDLKLDWFGKLLIVPLLIIWLVLAFFLIKNSFFS